MTSVVGPLGPKDQRTPSRVLPMIELLEIRLNDFSGDLASGIHRLLRDAFPEDGPNEGDYYRALGAPEVAMVLRDGPQVFGHLGLYIREVGIGNETLEIGLLGGIAVAPDRRQRGYSRILVRHAHEYLKERHIPFSILFAYEPRIYVGSGYKLMQNATHFVEPDGTPRTFVHRGSMYAELSRRCWPNQLLDLRICVAPRCEQRISARPIGGHWESADLPAEQHASAPPLGQRRTSRLYRPSPHEMSLYLAIPFRQFPPDHFKRAV